MSVVSTLITRFSEKSTPEKIGIALSGIILLFLLGDALPKIFGAEFSTSAVEGLGFPPYQTALIGWVLLACTIVWAIPRTSVLGAVGLTAYLGGAVCIDMHAELWAPVVFAVGFGLLIWAAMILRRQELLKVLIG
ncbi:DoxX family protein [Mycobacterium sp. CBMA271]|uniref:DoxX family protein n=1 Tax=unclassified Mycobacteroides TaxID=2618759 RepID=UPI0012DD5809|nr:MULTISPECIES: DoxX family protein [unclassified Mycobacteroides]MUM15790.1 hypothetical protein [Mycobacteroides sp. CBMA 326]MUM24398.1 DoxX family protein [Mycobacteroides sp. CBMA 271]